MAYIEKASVKTNYDLVDIFKFTASLLVVAIHCNPLAYENEYVSLIFRECIARMAVPFFFICAGYFCFKKTEEDRFNIKITNKYALRMIILYLIWYSIYLISCLAFGNLPRAELTEGFVFGALHLWYLNGTALGFLLVGILFYKKISTKVSLIITSFLFLIGYLIEVCYGFFSAERGLVYRYGARNGLFFAPVFIVIGAMFAYGKIKINKRISAVGIGIFTFLWIGEAVLCYRSGHLRDYNMGLFMVPTLTFIFNNAINSDFKAPFNTKILRQMSTYIYFIHMIILYDVIPVLQSLAQRFTHSETVFGPSLKYTVVVFLSMLVSLIIIKLQKLRGFRWLRILS